MKKDFLKSFSAFFKNFTKSDKKVKILVAIGFIGILLLLLSELVPTKNVKKDAGEAKTSVVSKADEGAPSDYLQQIQNQLTQIIGQIDGAGKVQVMVTLENGIESVYAQDSTLETDQEGATDASGNKNQKSSEKSEHKYIIINNGDQDEALIVKEIQPQIRGVIVVCDGGDNPVVQQRILTAITAVFDLSSNRVCITKSKG